MYKQSFATLIATARELAAKATPGPWHEFHHLPGGRYEKVGVHCAFTEDTIAVSPSFASPQVLADAAFIAWARAGVPALCDALEAAETERVLLTIRERDLLAANRDGAERIAKLEAVVTAVRTHHKPFRWTAGSFDKSPKGDWPVSPCLLACTTTTAPTFTDPIGEALAALDAADGTKAEEERDGNDT
jgi:hypothetical protein